MKKNNLLLIISLILLSGCEPIQIIQNSEKDFLSADILSLKDLYDRNKEFATKYSNFYIYGKEVSTNEFIDFYYYEYEDAKDSILNVSYKYKSVITMHSVENYWVAIEFETVKEAKYTRDRLNEYNKTDKVQAYKNIIYGRNAQLTPILFGKPEFMNGMYYIEENNKKALYGIAPIYYGSVTDLIVDDCFSRIYGYAFFGYKNIKTLTTSPFLKVIETSSFTNCSQLVEVNLKEGVEELGSYSFGGCTSLRQIKIPSSVKKIYRGAFYNCYLLESVIVPKEVLELGSEVFSHGSIYCEAKVKPRGWENDFAVKEAKVYWADEWEYDENGNPKLINQ